MYIPSPDTRIQEKITIILLIIPKEADRHESNISEKLKEYIGQIGMYQTLIHLPCVVAAIAKQKQFYSPVDFSFYKYTKLEFKRHFHLSCVMVLVLISSTTP